MIATRPDWCISRQRLWGVPIPAFYCKACGEAAADAPTSRDRVADVFEKESADAWYEREAKDLLPPGLRLPEVRRAEFDKEKDILDVWFDSGSSHAAVLGHRPDLPWPADVYLEGSDQHRGWFHSSLLIGVATRGTAPYRQVVTHGFTVDGDGQEDLEEPGQRRRHPEADQELRGRDPAPLDHHGRLPRGHALLRRDAEARGRGLPQDPQHAAATCSRTSTTSTRRRTRWPKADLDELDRYALARHRQVVGRVLEAYDAYEFHLVYHQLVQYCAADLSVLLPGRAQGPALLRRRGRARGGARRRPCSTASPRTWRCCSRRSCPSRPTRSGRSFPGARGLGPHGRLPPEGDARTRRCSRRWAGPPRRPRRGDEGPRRGPGREGDRLAAWRRGSRSDGPGRGARRPCARHEADEPRLPRQPRQPLHRERGPPRRRRGTRSRSRSSGRRGPKCERCWTYSRERRAARRSPGRLRAMRRGARRLMTTASVVSPTSW